MRRFVSMILPLALLAGGLASIMYPWFVLPGVPATVRAENVPEINYIWMIRNLMDAGHPFTLWNPSFLGGEAVLTHQIYPVYWLIAAFSKITGLAVEVVAPGVVFLTLLASGSAVAAYIWLLTRHQGGAVVGGLVSMMMPGRYNTIEGIYISLGWAFFTLALAAYEYTFVHRKIPSTLASMGMGLALGFMAWSSIQAALMAVLVLGPYIVWRESQQIGRILGIAQAERRAHLGQRVRAWGVTALFASAIAVSYYVPTLIELKNLGFSRFMADPSGVTLPVSFLAELLTMRWTPAFTPTRYHHVTWYIGGFALVLALIGAIPKPKQWGVRLFWLLMAIGCLLLINGDNLFYRIVDSLPLLNGALRRSFRFIVPFSLGLAVLAGLGVARLSRQLSKRGEWVGIVAPALLILAVMIDYHPHFGSFRMLPSYLTPDEQAAVTWLNQQEGTDRYLSTFNYGMDEKGYLAGYNAAFTAHQIHREGSWEDSYIGHFAPLPGVEIMGMTNVDHPLWRTDSVEPAKELWALSNIRHVVLNLDSDPNLSLFQAAVDAGLPVAAEIGNIRILEIPGVRAKFQIYHQAALVQEGLSVAQMADALAEYQRSQTAMITGPVPDTVDLASLASGSLASSDIAPTIQEPSRAVVDVELDTSAVLVMAYNWFPGWRVTVDGEAAPLLRVNHAYQGVLLAPGAHSVEFSYRPPWYVLLTNGLSILALVAAFGLLVGDFTVERSINRRER